MAKKGGLGKGLDAIFHDNARADDGGAVELNINELEPNRGQPRKEFSEEAMRELADSIAAFCSRCSCGRCSPAGTRSSPASAGGAPPAWRGSRPCRR